MTKLPKRAASRKIFIFWQLVAFVMMLYGFGMLIDGEGYLSFILIAGGFGMSLREASLRWRWKKQQKESKNA